MLGGGTGTWAVQIAKHYGAFVVAICGPDSVNTIKSLGADQVIDYRTATGTFQAKFSITDHLTTNYNVSEGRHVL